MKILITGGAGYIGSHMVIKLLEAGHQPVIIDDLSTGLKSFVQANVPLHIFNLTDEEKLNQLFKTESFDMVMHFAASIRVEESVGHPEKFYQNNFVTTLKLLQAMNRHNVKKIIFSSTAAIFGEPQYTPADEKHPKNPINPYGTSKLMCEKLLHDFDIAYGIKSVSLRYFNAAGADAKGRTGYRTQHASHLIPAVLQTALGLRPQVELFGQDYETADGTCIRDYIHVMDLCEAHLVAMNYLITGGESKQYNVGNGHGYSVKQVIETAKSITSKPIKVVHSPRRAGDPAKLVADSQLIQAELKWKPHYPELETIIQHAWQWEQHVAQSCGKEEIL